MMSREEHLEHLKGRYYLGYYINRCLVRKEGVKKLEVFVNVMCELRQGIRLVTQVRPLGFGRDSASPLPCPEQIS